MQENHEHGFYFVSVDAAGVETHDYAQGGKKFEGLAKFMIDNGHAKTKEQDSLDDKQTFKLLCSLRKELKDALDKIKELQKIVDDRQKHEEI